MANPRNGPSLAEKNPVFVCRAAPAPGYRDAGYYKGFGALRDVGSSGYSWSSSLTGTYARNLVFYPGGLYPQDGLSRAYGLPLRCLQE